MCALHSDRGFNKRILYCIVLDAGGQLRDKDGKPFVFKVHDSDAHNQKRYETIGEVHLLDHVFTLHTRVQA